MTLRRAIALLLLLLTPLLQSACGKRRPPLPPVERIPQRTELLSGVQQGNRVVLSWPTPRRNASEGSVQSIRRMDIYRLAEEVDAPLALSEEEFSARATLIGSVPFEQFADAEGTINYVDELLLTEPVRLRYAIRYVNAAGQRAPYSNFLFIEPATTVSLPPVLSDKAEVTQNAVTLRWQQPTANIDASTPPNLLGYNIYRTGGSQRDFSQRPLNAEILKSESFSDQNFQFGEEYSYVVRAVSLGTGGNPVESLNSNAVTLRLLDTFKPTPPTGLTAAASPAPPRLSLFFAANPERDVIGYYIYRTTEPARPKTEWTQLNQKPLDRTTFQDTDVQRGIRYHYYVRAIDNAGNISEPSEVVSDQIP
jgi:predicted phage tail protein